METETGQIFNLNNFNGLSDSLENLNTHSEEIRESILENILDSLARQNYPFYESDSKVVLIYKGKAQTVELLSDITGWTDPIRFKQVGGSDLFYLKIELEPDARNSNICW